MSRGPSRSRGPERTSERNLVSLTKSMVAWSARPRGPRTGGASRLPVKGAANPPLRPLLEPPHGSDTHGPDPRPGVQGGRCLRRAGLALQLCPGPALAWALTPAAASGFDSLRVEAFGLGG